MLLCFASRRFIFVSEGRSSAACEPSPRGLRRRFKSDCYNASNAKSCIQRYGASSVGVSDRIARLSPHQVRVLARRLRRIAGPTTVEVPPVSAQVRPEHLPLSFAQERLWLLEQIEGAGSAYNIAGVVRLCGTLDVDVLEIGRAHV